MFKLENGHEKLKKKSLVIKESNKFSKQLNQQK